MGLTFKGGTLMSGRKEMAETKAIEKAYEPEKVYIALHQHAGSACKPLVKKGDEVKVGQKIGDLDEGVFGAYVHSSVSGVVEKIEKIYTPDGYFVEHIVIESDGKDELHDTIKPIKDPEKLSREELVNIIKEAGIAGLGGAAFPTYKKFEATGIDSIILNGAECEPFLTCDDRLMLERSDDVVSGLELILRLYEGSKGYIGIEDNKKGAIEQIKKSASGKKNIEVSVLQTKFPQGDSYRMVDAILGRTVPKEKRCADVNALVCNVGTAAAISHAVYEGMPLIERVVTVTGNGVKNPKNLLVKIGTPIKDLIQQCGGFNGTPGKIIAGGPMTGYAQFSIDTAITKGVTGITVLTEEEAKPQPPSPCIKCGKCLDVCPTHLEPLNISANALAGRFEVCDELSATACIECGSCSYICPSKRPLSESIAHANRQIRALRGKEE